GDGQRPRRDVLERRVGEQRPSQGGTEPRDRVEPAEADQSSLPQRQQGGGPGSGAEYPGAARRRRAPVSRWRVPLAFERERRDGPERMSLRFAPEIYTEEERE